MSHEPMRRDATQSVEEMASQLAESSGGNRLNRAPTYGEISAEMKRQSLNALITQQQGILRNTRAKGRIDLNDLEAVQRRVDEYLESCKIAGVVPSMTALAPALGYSRIHIYEYIRSARTESARFLDSLRSSWAAIIEQLSFTRQCSEPVGIFLLKNAGQGMADRIDVTASPVSEPIEEEFSAEDIVRRYALPSEDSNNDH